MEKKKSNGWKWFFAIMFLLILGFISMMVAGFLSLFTSNEGYIYTSGTGNVAVIKIDGPIAIGSSDGLFASGGTSSTDVVNMIKEANEDKSIKAIMFEINSPGGSPVASDEIGQAIKETNKTTVSVIREVGASGAYWIASSTDHIIANRMSITGSIGVYSSYLDFSGFLDDHNVTYEQLNAGKYKDSGSPFKELTTDERRVLQAKIDKIHEYFIEEVASNRNLPVEDVKAIATGMFYLGSEAKELKLIDELGGEKEAEAYLQTRLNVTEVDFVYFETRKSFWDSMFSAASRQSYSVGRGIGDSIMAQKDDFRITT